MLRESFMQDVTGVISFDDYAYALRGSKEVKKTVLLLLNPMGTFYLLLNCLVLLIKLTRRRSGQW